MKDFHDRDHRSQRSWGEAMSKGNSNPEALCFFGFLDKITGFFDFL